ncbi:MAG TPA: enoyl-CoA hydratase/isomerase family protein [Steroidobacteraceae bacterium]|nr:enoyl-CoA hydratase/isomerase family protein [Steroidobacteraceae bacterium]
MNTEATTGTALEVRREQGFWFARLNRPAKRNALSDQSVQGLAELFDTVAADSEARALLLWGAGGNFSAGADFDGFLRLMSADADTDAGEDSIARYNRAFGSMLEKLVALPVPTLAVVRGAAMGGGCGLAAACDHVLAAEDAAFAMPEVTLGVAPAQIAPFVVRRIGATRARWLMLSGERLDAGGAFELGLADQVSAAPQLRTAVNRALAQLALAEPGALHATKRIVDRSIQAGLAESLDAAAREFAHLLRNGSAREGIAAVRERRTPTWRIAAPELPEFD